MAGARGLQLRQLHVPNVMKSRSLNLLEPSGPRRACYGTPLLFKTWWYAKKPLAFKKLTIAQEGEWAPKKSGHRTRDKSRARGGSRNDMP